MEKEQKAKGKKTSKTTRQYIFQIYCPGTFTKLIS